jgi:hypothetical protein
MMHLSVFAFAREIAESMLASKFSLAEADFDSADAEEV